MAILILYLCLICLLRAAAVVDTNNDASALLAVRNELRKFRPENSSLVCVIVRTYWKHGSAYSDGLRQLLDSLLNQTHRRYEMQLNITAIQGCQRYPHHLYATLPAIH
jgi:hypothetical protein